MCFLFYSKIPKMGYFIKKRDLFSHLLSSGEGLIGHGVPVVGVSE
jgi:hypothetical protein